MQQNRKTLRPGRVILQAATAPRLSGGISRAGSYPTSTPLAQRFPIALQPPIKKAGFLSPTAKMRIFLPFIKSSPKDVCPAANFCSLASQPNLRLTVHRPQLFSGQAGSSERGSSMDSVGQRQRWSRGSRPDPRAAGPRYPAPRLIRLSPPCQCHGVGRHLAPVGRVAAAAPAPPRSQVIKGVQRGLDAGSALARARQVPQRRPRAPGHFRKPRGVPGFQPRSALRSIFPGGPDSADASTRAGHRRGAPPDADSVCEVARPRSPRGGGPAPAGSLASARTPGTRPAGLAVRALEHVRRRSAPLSCRAAVPARPSAGTQTHPRPLDAVSANHASTAYRDAGPASQPAPCRKGLGRLVSRSQRIGRSRSLSMLRARVLACELAPPPPGASFGTRPRREPGPSAPGSLGLGAEGRRWEVLAYTAARSGGSEALGEAAKAQNRACWLCWSPTCLPPGLNKPAGSAQATPAYPRAHQGALALKTGRKGNR
jgi:hypothetical protein